MDLRPKLADDFIDAIVDDLQDRRGFSHVWDALELEQQAEIKTAWKAAILERFVSHSLDIGDETNPALCQAFIDKYPRLQELIDLAMDEATKRFEGVRFSLDIRSDPEGSHITHEGQHITLNIHTQLAFYGEDDELDGSPYDLADNDWLEWQCVDGTSWQKLVKDIGETADLLHLNLKWDPEVDEE